jgi:hypothetical protein
MIYQWTAEDITTLTGYISTLIGEFLPLILLVLGITLGLYVLQRIFKL